MDIVFRKKVKRKVKFRKKLKRLRLRESELKEEFDDGVNNKCDGNEDWYDLKSKLLDVASEVCGYTKDKPILKLGGGTKMWMWLCVERGSYLGFGDRVGMRKIGRNIARQKKCQESSIYGNGSESSGGSGEG